MKELPALRERKSERGRENIIIVPLYSSVLEGGPGFQNTHHYTSHTLKNKIIHQQVKDHHHTDLSLINTYKHTILMEWNFSENI